MSKSMREVWEKVPTDPDPIDDLEYEHEPLTHIHVEEGNESYIFLPAEEDHLDDAEFIIAMPDDVCRLDERR